MLTAAPASAVVRHDGLPGPALRGRRRPHRDGRADRRRRGARRRPRRPGELERVRARRGRCSARRLARDGIQAARRGVRRTGGSYPRTSPVPAGLARNARARPGRIARRGATPWSTTSGSTAARAAVDGALTVAVRGSKAGWPSLRVVALSGERHCRRTRRSGFPPGGVGGRRAPSAWTPSVAQLRSARRANGGPRSRSASRTPGLVREVAFPTPEAAPWRRSRPTSTATRSEAFRQIVDASTGDVLFREPSDGQPRRQPALGGVPGHAPRGRRPVPVELPEQRHPRDVVLDGRRATATLAGGTGSRVPWDVDARTNGRRTRRSATTPAPARTGRTRRRRAVQRRPTSRTASTATRGRTPGSSRAATRTCSRRAATTSTPPREPVRDAQPDARWSYASASPRRRGTPRTSTSGSPARGGERRRSWATPRRAASTGGAPKSRA